MLAASPRRQEHFDSAGPGHQGAEDRYEALVNLVAQAANDPARVRKLIYAVVRSNLKPEEVFAPTPADATWQAKTLEELDQAFQIERAIKRLEERLRFIPLRSFAAPQTTEPYEPVRDFATELSARGEIRPPEPSPAAPAPPAEAPTATAADPPITRSELQAALKAALRELPVQSAGDTVRQVPPAQPEIRSEIYRPSRAARLWTAWIALPTQVHVVASALVVATIVTGISSLLHHGRGVPSPEAATERPPRVGAAVSVAVKGPRMTETVGHAPAQGLPAGTDPRLPFPMPRSFGVYAATAGALTQLEPLPVAVAAPQARMSAELREPSRTVLPADKLSFVVFDPALVNTSPPVASARVIGRITRLVRYVDGHVHVTPYSGSWRVRDKSYALSAELLPGRDIAVIRPAAGVMLPAGRYALVLNGRGYDFTVAGRVTALEQCLEQTEVVNGFVVGDCTNL